MMVQDDIFHFVGRPHTRQVSINVQAAKHTVSFYLTMRKTTCEKSVNSSHLFNKYLNVYSVPGTILGTGNIIVNNYMKSPAHVSYIL